MSQGVSRPTIASDEDMDRVFVLRDEHAPTAEDALAVLLARAPEEWGYRVSSQVEDDIAEPTRRWFKQVNEREENLVRCEPDDPDRDSEWWVFDDIEPGDWEDCS